jgi:hypothetical protein
LTVQELNLEAAARRLSVSKKPCNCHDGLSVASLVAAYLSEPSPAIRARLLSLPITTRADARSVLAILQRGEDAQLAGHLIGCLHSYLSAA